MIAFNIKEEELSVGLLVMSVGEVVVEMVEVESLFVDEVLP